MTPETFPKSASQPTRRANVRFYPRLIQQGWQCLILELRVLSNTNRSLVEDAR